MPCHAMPYQRGEEGTPPLAHSLAHETKPLFSAKNNNVSRGYASQCDPYRHARKQKTDDELKPTNQQTNKTTKRRVYTPPIPPSVLP